MDTLGRDELCCVLDFVHSIRDRLHLMATCKTMRRLVRACAAWSKGVIIEPAIKLRQPERFSTFAASLAVPLVHVFVGCCNVPTTLSLLVQAHGATLESLVLFQVDDERFAAVGGEPITLAESRLRFVHLMATVTATSQVAELLAKILPRCPDLETVVTNFSWSTASLAYAPKLATLAMPAYNASDTRVVMRVFTQAWQKPVPSAVVFVHPACETWAMTVAAGHGEWLRVNQVYARDGLAAVHRAMPRLVMDDVAGAARLQAMRDTFCVDMNVRTGFAYTPRACFTFSPVSVFSTEVDTSTSLVEVHADEGYAPIHLAAIYRLPVTLTALIRMGATVDLPTRQSGLTALALASAGGWLEGVELLIGAKADAARLDHAHWTPLMHACANASMPSANRIACLLLGAAPAALHYRCQDTGLDAVALAARCGASEVLQQLFSAGAVLRDDSMALHMQLAHAASSALSLTTLTGQPSCSLATVTQDNVTPLLRACLNGTPEAVETLLSHPSCAIIINVADTQGRVSAFRVVPTNDASGRTPLHGWLGGESPSPEVALRLVGAGANCCAVDTRGRTPLLMCMLARQRRIFKTTVVTRLLEDASVRASVNVADVNGLTPLAVAAFLFDSHLVKELLGAGADPTASDCAGNTALHATLMRPWLECTEKQLWECAPKENTSDYVDYSSALTQLMALSVIQVLRKRPDFAQIVAHRNRDGYLPLHLACMRRMCTDAVVEALLVPLPADVALERPSSGRGQSPLHLAALQGNLEAVRALLSREPRFAAATNHAGETTQSTLLRLFAFSRSPADAVVFHFLQTRQVYMEGLLYPWWLPGGPSVSEVRDTSITLRSVALCYNWIASRFMPQPDPLAASMYIRGRVREPSLHEPHLLVTAEALAATTQHDDGETLLHAFARHGSASAHVDKFVERFRECGKADDFARRDSDGRTPLLVAAALGSPVVVIALVPWSDVNATDRWGNTALHYAQSAAVVTPLLVAGARPDVRNLKGETPLLLAIDRGQAALAVQLLRGGAASDDTALRRAERFLSFTHGSSAADLEVLRVLCVMGGHAAPPSLPLLSWLQLHMLKQLLEGSVSPASEAELLKLDASLSRAQREGMPSTMDDLVREMDFESSASMSFGNSIAGPVASPAPRAFRFDGRRNDLDALTQWIRHVTATYAVPFAQMSTSTWQLGFDAGLIFGGALPALPPLPQQPQPPQPPPPQAGDAANPMVPFAFVYQHN